ncbi:hypothetical protein CSX04_08416 [Burkholderia cepacia]|nr:hypothetical protein CSX04_08416 [Burkholderia cepacia]
MGRAFHLDEDRGLESAETAESGDMQRRSGGDLVELHGLLQAIAGYIGLDRSGHLADRRFDLRPVCRFGQHIDRVAHHERRLGRVEHDDRLALSGAADRFDRLRRRLREFVDVGARAGPSRLAADRCDDFRVMHLCDPRHGRDHRDRRLSAARDHVHVRRIEMRVEVHHRHTIRADGSGRQVDHANAGLERAQERVVLHMRAGGRRIEHEVDLVEYGQARQPFHAFMRRRHAEPRGAREAVRGRIDADHRRDVEMPAATHDLDHQVGADVAGSDDRGFAPRVVCCHGNVSVRHSLKLARTLPSPSICAV